ncbi:MAG: hypothetical protein JWM82_547 [Myxococcales bacterium]|nr:hypothetical protein [Myxococcales bacterium]
MAKPTADAAATTRRGLFAMKPVAFALALPRATPTFFNFRDRGWGRFGVKAVVGDRFRLATAAPRFT